mmetsp:Transcript_51495/g.167043  ORF Transcript_51495/g.167043 Transcript_51495/m.167043 type:complete len:236 (+) Transcript_51495:1347-2054(+)
MHRLRSAAAAPAPPRSPAPTAAASAAPRAPATWVGSGTRWRLGKSRPEPTPLQSGGWRTCSFPSQAGGLRPRRHSKARPELDQRGARRRRTPGRPSAGADKRRRSQRSSRRRLARCQPRRRPPSPPPSREGRPRRRPCADTAERTSSTPCPWAAVPRAPPTGPGQEISCWQQSKIPWPMAPETTISATQISSASLARPTLPGPGANLPRSCATPAANYSAKVRPDSRAEPDGDDG